MRERAERPFKLLENIQNFKFELDKPHKFLRVIEYIRDRVLERHKPIIEINGEVFTPKILILPVQNEFAPPKWISNLDLPKFRFTRCKTADKKREFLFDCLPDCRNSKVV